MGLRDGVHIERWSEEDLALLTALNGDPEQMRHIGTMMVCNDWRWEG